jgi:hypothetical protein
VSELDEDEDLTGFVVVPPAAEQLVAIKANSTKRPSIYFWGIGEEASFVELSPQNFHKIKTKSFTP